MRKRSSNRNNNTVPGFLSKTYKILENPEYAEIISWNEDGKAFKVKKPNEFAEKLNMYDFHKLRHDSEENEWRHRLFRRGHPNLLSEIKRKINETQIQDAVVTQKEQKKITNDTQYLLKEMVGLKQKQESLDKACAVLIAQNNQILGENKLLWGELNKKKEKSQKKVEKLFSLFFTYIGPSKLHELALLNNSKNNKDFLKQEEISIDDEMDDQRGFNMNSNRGQINNNSNNKQQQQQHRWDLNDLNQSLNLYPFQSINGMPNQNQALGNSLNDQPLNASNMLSQSTNNNNNNNNSSMADNMESGEQNIAQKIMDGLMKNMQRKQDGKGDQQQQHQQQQQNSHVKQSSQFNTFVDTFHQSNQDLLSQIQNTIFPLDLNSSAAAVGAAATSTSNALNAISGDDNMLVKRPIKKMMNNTFNPDIDLSQFLEASGNHNIDESVLMSKPVKKLKKEIDDNNNNNNANSNNNMNSVARMPNRFNSINPALIQNNNASFNLEDYFNINNNNHNNNNHNNNTSLSRDIFGNDNHNKMSLDFQKLLQLGGVSGQIGDIGTNGFSTLALPLSTTGIEAQSIQIGGQKNTNGISSNGTANNTTGQQQNVQKPILPQQKKNVITAGMGNVLARNTNPHQQNQQWADFTKFIDEQKIEVDDSLANSTLIGSSLPVIPNADKLGQSMYQKDVMNDSLLQ